MGRFVVGDVVVVWFPFSNLKQAKRRPALVLARGEFDNLILCQITSKSYASRSTIRVTATDFLVGKLPLTSFIRPDKLFTADPSIIEKTVGRITPQLRKIVLARVRQLF